MKGKEHGADFIREPRSERDPAKGARRASAALNRRLSSQAASNCGACFRLRSLNGNAPPGSLSPARSHLHLTAEFGNKAFELPVTLAPMKIVRKAVFPVAGLGTRFLPATKAMPKEMLPVVDRPLIQHVVDEAREARIEHFIFVTGRNKAVIEDHFDRQFELEMTLLERQKHDALKFLTEELPIPGSTSFTRQQEPLGLGHAVWCARELVGREPFALLLPDVLVQHERSCLAQMIA